MANVAVEKEKSEKTEKRRALGRGLDSLLPGPRVVTGDHTSELRPQTSGSTPHPAEQQVPHRVSDSVRNDSVRVPAESQSTQLVEQDTTKEAHAGDSGTRAGAPAPHESVAQTAHLPAQNAGRVRQPVLETEIDLSGWEGPYQDDAEEPGEGPISIQAVADTRVPSNLVINLAIADIDKNPFQTRHIAHDAALEELANSIRTNGVVQPIVVRPAEKEGRYILILGQRRIQASKKAGKTHIPAIVRRVSTQQAAEMTIIENLQRDDLSPMEHAEAFRILSTEFRLSQAQIGQRVGLSRESVANYMRLLKLPVAVTEMLANKSLSFSKAKELMRLEDDLQVSRVAQYVVARGMTLEEIQTLVTNLEMGGSLVSPMERKPSGARWVDPNVRAAQTELQRILGLKVKISDRKGRGKIVIEYATVEDYERVVEMLSGKQ